VEDYPKAAPCKLTIPQFNVQNREAKSILLSFRIQLNQSIGEFHPSLTNVLQNEMAPLPLLIQLKKGFQSLGKGRTVKSIGPIKSSYFGFTFIQCFSLFQSCFILS
jgi:hypothetical protein